MSGKGTIIEESLVDYIVQNYNISPVCSVTPVAAGFLSENYVLQTVDEKYFLKRYRYSKQQAVAAAHEAKFFFAQAKIPVILPLSSNSGETFFALAENYYSLFPFVAGQHIPRGTFSLRALASSAKMLAHIHQAGQLARPTYLQKSPAQQSQPQFVEAAQQIVAKIPRHNQTAFDALALASIGLKLYLAKQNEEAFVAIDLASDHLIHGDYQDANLFFDGNEQVSHVFDWEKAQIAPRGLELVRALEFICFSNPVDYKAEFVEGNYQKARHFLQSYQQHYPISRSEFFAAAQARYLQKILSLWVEAAHYLENSRRVDLFLEAEYTAVQYYSHHLHAHVERLSSGLLL